MKAFYSLEFFFHEGALDYFIVTNFLDDRGAERVKIHKNPRLSFELDDEEEPEIIISSLSQTYSKDGVDVRVDIYRSDDESAWVLEVTDEHGTSLVYEEEFSTDSEARAQFERDVKEEGIGYFIHETPVSKHLH